MKRGTSLFLLLVLAGVPWACGGEPAETESGLGTAAPRSSSDAPLRDVTAQVGLDFDHVNGMRGELYFHEMMGSGVALLDYDNDGDLDLYLVQGGTIGSSREPNRGAGPESYPARDRLYRNDLVLLADGTTGFRLTDVTEESGLSATGYGMGVATGDYDNDGWIDLYVLNFGSNQLWRNRGDGTFHDVTAASGSDDARWSVSASFVDFDRDGWLDLFVTNYVNYSVASHQRCYAPNSRPDYCGPQSYRGQSDRLLRNLGDGRFEDVSATSGVLAFEGSGLGVVSADFNNDGWPDLYVANDQMPNFLWLNQRDGTFVEDALIAGCAVNLQGEAEASMGVLAFDFDNDGDEDLFLTHLGSQSNTLYRNEGGGFFSDRTPGSGLGASSIPFTGFGAVAIDLQNDGWLDLMTANGAVRIVEARVEDGRAHPLDERNQLFENRGGSFVEMSAAAGEIFSLSEVSRGVAGGDLDNDGDLDLVVTNNLGPARILLNVVGQSSHWIGLRLQLEEGGRDALGARVELRSASGQTLWRRVHTDGSYGSASDPRVLFGLGDEEAVQSVIVHWPRGRAEVWSDLEIDRYWSLVEGGGDTLATQ